MSSFSASVIPVLELGYTKSTGNSLVCNLSKLYMCTINYSMFYSSFLAPKDLHFSCFFPSSGHYGED